MRSSWRHLRTVFGTFNITWVILQLQELLLRGNHYFNSLQQSEDTFKAATPSDGPA